MSFIGELRRRHVVRVGIAYLAFAWVVLQIVDVVAPILELPDWVAKAVLLALAIGLAAALVTAWFFEWTSDGLVREDEIDRNHQEHSMTRALTSRLIIVFLSIAVLILLLDRVFDLSGGQAVSEGQESVSLVVLPLDSVTPGDEQGFFVQGMHDALIIELTKIDALKVVSRTSSLRYRDSPLSLPEIARELDVDMVIEGSVLRAGDQVRITTQLVSASDDQPVWGGSFDRELTDILSLYSDVARQVARQVEVTITPADRARLDDVRQVNPEAYRKYLEARYLLDTWSPLDMLRGLELMREALALDPSSPLLHAGLAVGLQYTAWFNFIEPVSVLQEARHAADRAIALDPGSAEAWVAEGAVSYYLEFDLQVAVDALERALELHPGNRQAHIHYAWLPGEAGQFDRSVELARRSIELDPFSPVAHNTLAQSYLLSRDFEKSLQSYSKALELDQRDPSAHYFMAWPLFQLGEIEQAIEFAQTAIRMSGGAPMYRAGLAYMLAASGDEGRAREILSELRDENAQPFHLAEVHLGLGEYEPALEQLERAYEARNSLLLYIRHGPRFDPLRGYPRFEALIDRFGWSRVTYPRESAALTGTSG